MSFYVRGRFFETCARLLELPRDRAVDLLQGADQRLLDDSAALQRLAEDIRRHPDTTTALLDDDNDALAVVRASPFAAAFAGYLDEHGHRPLDGYDITRERLYEHPEIAASLVRDTLRSVRVDRLDTPPTGTTDVAALRARLSGPDREEFDHWLALARRARTRSTSITSTC